MRGQQRKRDSLESSPERYVDLIRKVFEATNQLHEYAASNRAWIDRIRDVQDAISALRRVNLRLPSGRYTQALAQYQDLRTRASRAIRHAEDWIRSAKESHGIE